MELIYDATMELMCCGKRPAPRPSLFPSDRRLGHNIDDLHVPDEASAEEHNSATSRGQREDEPRPRRLAGRNSIPFCAKRRPPSQAPPDHASSADEDEDMDLSPLEQLTKSVTAKLSLEKVGDKLKAKHKEIQRRKANHEDSESSGTTVGTTAGSLDAFLVDGVLQQPAEAEEAMLARLKQIAAQLRGAVRAESSERHGSFLPDAAPENLHLELVPHANGLGLQPWIHGELAFWESEEAFVEKAKPVVAVRLRRIAKVKHIAKHNGGCSVRLRLRNPESQEVFENILVHGSVEKAKACEKGLTECIHIARAASGRRTSVGNSNGTPA